MAKYEKLTLVSFRKKLREGGYGSATGARRAVGKCKSWSTKDQEAARRSIDKFFSDAPPAAKKKTAKKASKKKASKKKTAKKKTAKKKFKTGASKSPKDSHIARHIADNRARAGKKRTKAKKADDIFENNPLAAISIIGEITGKAEDGVKVMKMLKDATPSVDITEGMQAAQSVLTKSMTHLGTLIEGFSGGSDDGKGNGAQASEDVQKENFGRAAPPPPPPPSTPGEAAATS